jgi:hypothetical protein
MAIELNSTNLNAAKQLLGHPLFDSIFDDMEASAVNLAIAAQLTDNETRAAYLSEARAIRTLRQKLRFMVAQGAAISAEKGAQG